MNPKPELVLTWLDGAAKDGRPYHSPAEAAAAIRELIAERDKYREWAATFIALWSATYAQRHGAPSTSHVVAEHYDMMAECGCRMDDFVRWEP